jgi:hypothetical protein
MDKSVLVFQTQYTYDSSTGTYATERDGDPLEHVRKQKERRAFFYNF